MVPCALANTPALASSFEALSMSACAAAIWIACASLPRASTCNAAQPWLAPALALPTLALGAGADLNASAALFDVAVQALFCAVAVAWLSFSAARARGGVAYRAAWFSVLALPPAVVVALELGVGAQAPLWARAWASFSPVQFALDNLSLAHASSPVSVWRPLVGAALIGALAHAPNSTKERAP